jgi:H+/Cl- antiporter ClcA
MSKKAYVTYTVLGILTGFLFVPSLLDWLGVPSLSDVFDKVLGEPNWVNGIIVFLFIAILVYFLGRGFYKGYKNID